MVPPAERRIIRSLTDSNIAVDQETQTMHRRPVESSGAEGTTLRAVLYDLNQGVG
jgi:hypothetical protein